MLLSRTLVCVRSASLPTHVPSGPKHFGPRSSSFLAGSNLRLTHMGPLRGPSVTAAIAESGGFARKLSIRFKTVEKLGSCANLRETGQPCCTWKSQRKSATESLNSPTTMYCRYALLSKESNTSVLGTSGVVSAAVQKPASSENKGGSGSISSRMGYCSRPRLES